MSIICPSDTVDASEGGGRWGEEGGRGKGGASYIWPMAAGGVTTHFSWYLNTLRDFLTICTGKAT